MTPVFFGSAMNNFGLEPFLDQFVDLAQPPRTRNTSIGPLEADAPNFSGFVFKIQANMDPQHRDRIAFMRICSGKFNRGMDVQHVRTGKTLSLTRPVQFMAQERTLVDEAFSGDILGVWDPGILRIGDSLCQGPPVEFEGIPRFSPEHFVRVRLDDPLKRKQLKKGLEQLSEEGAVQLFFDRQRVERDPILGAVGVLQFEIIEHRLLGEYRVRIGFDRLPYRFARWIEPTEPGQVLDYEKFELGGRQIVRVRHRGAAAGAVRERVADAPGGGREPQDQLHRSGSAGQEQSEQLNSCTSTPRSRPGSSSTLIGRRHMAVSPPPAFRHSRGVSGTSAGPAQAFCANNTGGPSVVRMARGLAAVITSASALVAASRNGDSQRLAGTVADTGARSWRRAVATLGTQLAQRHLPPGLGRQRLGAGGRSSARAAPAPAPAAGPACPARRPPAPRRSGAIVMGSPRPAPPAAACAPRTPSASPVARTDPGAPPAPRSSARGSGRPPRTPGAPGPGTVPAPGPPG